MNIDNHQQYGYANIMTSRNIVTSTSHSPVIVDVPVVGAEVWFESHEEMMEGMTIEGTVTQVGLVSFTVEVNTGSRTSNWTLRLNDPNQLYFFSYMAYLEYLFKETVQENREYYKKFGPLT